MSDFSTATTTRGALDPTKRVKYSLGLVLGVDEFDQEQTYLMARDHLHQRGLHGYGTVCGLRVSMEEGSPPEVLVSPGMAVNPIGQTIRVPLAQCAKLNDWLENNETAVSDYLTLIGGNTLSLYVVLCYRECETDLVPIPGGPCRLQEDSMAASRIADGFELSFRFRLPDEVSPEESSIDPSMQVPQQVEEEVVRRFGALLQRIEITHESADFITAEELADLVRALTEAPTEEPDTSPLYLDAEESCAILHAAFRVWVTEVRPTLLTDGRNCAGGEPDESCVILSRLDMSLTEGGAVNGDVTVVDDERPVLLHSRLLQEWLLCGNSGGQSELSRTFATLSAPNETTIRAWLHHPRPLSQLESTAVNVRVNGTAVTLSGITRPVAGANVFDLALDSTVLSNDDRVGIQFDLENMSEVGDDGDTSLAEIADDLDYELLDRGNNTVTAYLVIVGIPLLDDLADVSAAEPDDGDIISWDSEAGEWVNGPHSHSLDELTNVDIPAESPPQDQDLLKFNGAVWQPGTISLDNLSDASTSDPNEPDEGDILTWKPTEDHPDGVWVPEPLPANEPSPHNHSLGGLSDVTAPTGVQHGDEKILQWNQPTSSSRGAWNLVETPTQGSPGGDFVFAQHGYYEIVGAGVFSDKGTPMYEPYNGLQANIQGDGRYLLTFTDYKPPQPEGNFTYIVKGTVMDPGLPDRMEIPFMEPESTATPFAVFQVVDFMEEGILIAIAQPILFGELIGRAIRQDIEPEAFENMLRFNLVNRQFMVEISYYESSQSDDPRFEGRVVNINTATEAELRSVPRIGPTLAANIIADRETNGTFSSVDDLTRVSGIGTSSIEDVRPFLTIRGR